MADTKTAKTRKSELDRVRKAFMRHTIELFERDEHIVPVAVLMNWKQPGDSDKDCPDGGYAFAMVMRDPIEFSEMIDDKFMNVTATIVGKTSPEAVFIVGEMLGLHREDEVAMKALVEEIVARGDDPAEPPPEAERMLVMQLETHEKLWVAIIHVDEDPASGRAVLRKSDCEWDDGSHASFRFLDGEKAKDAEN